MTPCGCCLCTLWFLYDGSASFLVIPVRDTGIQTLIVILVNKSGKNKRSSQNAVFLLK
ncbi:MAG: hypothetical protein ACR5LA_07510 [Wolbachia sp.]